MERGELAVGGSRPTTVFVFEGLIAHFSRSRLARLERTALRLHKWEIALDFWAFDQQVCDYMHRLIYAFELPVEVITWHPFGFDDVLHDRLWAMDVPVQSTTSGEYSSLSPRLAVNQEIGLVYDADPSHRFGYGFKCREFSVGRY